MTTTHHPLEAAHTATASAARSAPDGAAAHRRQWRPNFYALLGLPAILFALGVFIVPAFVVLVRSLTVPDPGSFLVALQDPIFLRSVVSTVRMSLVVTVVCLIVGFPYAYVLARSGPIVRNLLFAALLVSFWTSILVRTYAWQIILNNTGVINSFLIDTGLIDSPLPLIRNDFAVYVGMAQVLSPLMILALFAQLTSVKPELEQAAQSLGARPAVAFFTITVPLAAPGAAAGAILVFVTAMGFYILPEILGDATQKYLGSMILQQQTSFLNPGVASAMAVILLVIVLVAVLLCVRFFGLAGLTGRQIQPEGKP